MTRLRGAPGIDASKYFRYIGNATVLLAPDDVYDMAIFARAVEEMKRRL